MSTKTALPPTKGNELQAAIEAAIRQGATLAADVIKQVSTSTQKPEREVRAALDELLSRGHVVLTSEWKLRTTK